MTFCDFVSAEASVFTVAMLSHWFCGIKRRIKSKHIFICVEISMITSYILKSECILLLSSSLFGMLLPLFLVDGSFNKRIVLSGWIILSTSIGRAIGYGVESQLPFEAQIRMLIRIIVELSVIITMLCIGKRLNIRFLRVQFRDVWMRELGGELRLQKLVYDRQIEIDKINKMIEDAAKRRHDINNHLQVIMALCEYGESVEAVAYLKSLLNNL